MVLSHILYILFANHLIVIWLVSDAKAADREDLFIRKLRQCSQVFDFTDPLGDLKVCLVLAFNYMSISLISTMCL